MSFQLFVVPKVPKQAITQMAREFFAGNFANVAPALVEVEYLTIQNKNEKVLPAITEFSA